MAREIYSLLIVRNQGFILNSDWSIQTKSGADTQGFTRVVLSASDLDQIDQSELRMKPDT